MSDLSIEERLGLVRQEALICPHCPLAQTRTHVVFGDGNPNTPLVLVGEGPGENEDETGVPFVGRAGVLLEQALKENGITRKHIYITNVVKCRAYTIENGRAKNRPPHISEVEACRPWLEQQLQIIQPLVILCIGAPSANALIHKNFKMTRERGQWFENTACAPWAMATLHPAYILRQEGEAYEQARRCLIKDIDSARRKVIEARKQQKTTLF
ncbi:MAG: uracil-DNA glycosylase [Armatimonadetes bacterium]|nr:uracil-DNA glycosylase [Armatimonadota bacterium]